jgi:ribosomal-protein-alanine N-acetyltransferase
VEGVRLDDTLVLLRPWEAADAEWYVAAAGDQLILRFTSEPPDLTVGRVRASIGDLAAREDVVGFAVCDSTSGQWLGNIGISYADGIGHVSYWVARAARGRGVATRALRLVSDWAVQTLALREVRLWTEVGNTGSQRVAERAGYRRQAALDQPRLVKRGVATATYILAPPG